ncbi:putative bifunctional diguanylate cyclase/phosphodiesterase [Piscinibacter koreensis]|uniref:EAL domain-containing protein n=1 Tax=Piscinibacter koreensis TaxID=2742824 RepID=A0A7Y6NJA1_9BURK|nr:EAL domain-containing protein [Schlegelella koreensis]NUZ04213.1 EAL domain-containing protein [Schlegelella koreensis]
MSGARVLARLRDAIVPPGDVKQAVRIRRFLLASGIYATCVPLLVLGHALGLGPAEGVLGVMALMLAINLGLYAAFRARLNLRFADPSLTAVQTVAAIVAVMAVVYVADGERALALVLCPVVLMFGAFRFDTRDFLKATWLVLVGYALVIALLRAFKPEVTVLGAELYRWLVLAVVLPCFALIAGKVSELRRNLKKTNVELGQALETIQQMASHDTLTGLPNRALFNGSLQHAIRRADRHGIVLALFFMDLDRFKHINDTLGHHVGDLALKEAARRLGTCIRGSDMAARLGGDEFVLLVEGFSDPAALVEIAERVLGVMNEPMTIDRHELNVSSSIGICMYPADAQDAQSLLANADIAMYAAKREGRNGYHFYSPRINPHSAQKLALEADLRRALGRDQFELYYQPRVRVDTGRVTGVEALLRWRHADSGLLLPERFMALAEETGLIVPIGLWALRSACLSAQAWLQRGIVLPVAVNLSARQFHHGRLLAEVAEILRTSGLPPRLLELELTETVVLQNPEAGIGIMQGLLDMGVRLTIDDFGVGPSSLTHLKRLPIANLKLDGDFVRALPDQRADVAVARAAIAMAHTLGINVVAEGVETDRQLELLRIEGCDEFQGHLCQPALGQAQLLRFVESRLTAPPVEARAHASAPTA